MILLVVVVPENWRTYLIGWNVNKVGQHAPARARCPRAGLLRPLAMNGPRAPHVNLGKVNRPGTVTSRGARRHGSALQPQAGGGFLQRASSPDGV